MGSPHRNWWLALRLTTTVTTPARQASGTNSGSESVCSLVPQHLFSAPSRHVGREKTTHHHPLLQQILKWKYTDCLHFNPYCFSAWIPHPSICFPTSFSSSPHLTLLSQPPSCPHPLCPEYRHGLNEEGNPVEGNGAGELPERAGLTLPRVQLPPGPLRHGSRKWAWQAAPLTGLFVLTHSGYSWPETPKPGLVHCS